MFGTFAITALLATLAGTAYADVAPTVPGPGVVYKVGGTCHIEWTGDVASTTAWKNMAIELMTGDNFHMVHLTTVATGLDGTVTGTFYHSCPDVNPYSAIYFYQFSAPGASGKAWTTRFAIASASGETTTPTEPTQPISNATIPWGTGKLVDASSAKPPPDFSITSSSTLVTPTPAPVPTPVPTSSSSTTSQSASIPISSGLVTIPSSSSSTATSSKTVTDTSSNAPSSTLSSEVVTHTSGPAPACSCSPPTTSKAPSSTLSSQLVTATPSPVAAGSSSTPTPSKMVTVTTSKVPTSTSSANVGSTTPKPTSSGSGKDNAAIGLDVKMWKTVVALGTSAMAFALL